MKIEFYKIRTAICVTSVFASACCFGQGTVSLEQRVAKGETDAFLQAADEGRKDLIPTMEKYAEYPADPREGVRIKARMALAKLGVPKYLDAIVAELTNTIVDAREPNGAAPSRAAKHARILAQTDAFRELAYVKNRSTVRVIASFLYAKETPLDYVDGAEPGSTDLWVLDTPSQMAMKTLAQILDNPPKIDIPDNAYTHDARVKAWQQWWEQNKDKYP
jgi:hypothetical protein